jgi:4-amino-4-deoxy-L-arabinose transferase-like glycosyltransferase
MSSLTFLESGSWGWWGVAAGTSLLVSFIHPYTLPIVILLLGLYLLWQTRRQVWSFWQGVGRLILIAAPAGPYLIYVLFVFETNFAFKAWRDQSLTSSPNPLHYVLGFGLLLPLVGLGLWQSQRTPMKHSAFLIIWVVVIPLLLYFPIPLQRRFLDGYQAPLAVFGAIGLGWLVDHLNTKVRRLLITVMILTLMTLTNLFLLLGGMTVISRQNSPVFHPGYQQTAFKWFDDNAQGQVVLTAYETGNILPAYAPVRVFVGHGPETIDSNEKRRLVTQLFTESTPNAWRQALLQEYGIHYLYYGPYERLLGDFSPSDASYLQQVYDNGTVQVYQVVKVKTEN